MQIVSDTNRTARGVRYFLFLCLIAWPLVIPGFVMIADDPRMTKLAEWIGTVAFYLALSFPPVCCAAFWFDRKRYREIRDGRYRLRILAVPSSIAFIVIACFVMMFVLAKV